MVSKRKWKDARGRMVESKEYYFSVREGGAIKRINTHCTVRSEAIKFEKQYRANLAAQAHGIDPDGDDLTLQEYAAIYFTKYAPEDLKGHKLIDTEKGRYRLHIKPILGNMYIVQIKARHIQLLYNSLQAKKDAGELSASTCNRILTRLSCIFKYAIFPDELIDVNPMAGFKRFKTDKGKRPTYSFQQCLRLLENADESIRPLLACFIYTGMRRSEALNLTWDSVDFDRLLIHIKKGKGNKDRIIPIFDEFATILRKLYSRHQGKWVFGWDNGKRQIRDFRHSYDMAVKRAGLPRGRVHDLRHTFATLCLTMGFTLDQVQAWLGHGSIKTTIDIYSHVDYGNVDRSRFSLKDNAGSEPVFKIVDGEGE